MTDFNPYAAPEAEPGEGPHPSGDAGVWRDGDILVMTKDADLGDRCVKCGAPCNGWRLKRSLSWHSGFWYLPPIVTVFLCFTVFFCVPLVLYFAVMMFVQQIATIYVPLCPRHRGKRRLGIACSFAISMLGLTLILAGIAVEGKVIVDVFGGSGAALVLGGLVYGTVSSQPVVVKRIDQEFVWLKKASPAYLVTLPAWSSL
jgi:hypothetical protein